MAHQKPPKPQETALPAPETPNPDQDQAKLPAKRSIITIEAEIEALMVMVADAGGELTDELELCLSNLEMEARNKCLSVAGWVRRLDMEMEGIKMHLADVQARKKALDGLKDRLKLWLFKGARVAGLVAGNEQDGWEGEKCANEQISLSWRKSEATIIEEGHPAYKAMADNNPQLFHYSVDPVDQQAGFELEDLIERGRLTLKEKTISKTRAEEAVRNGLPLAGIKLSKRINPQIKG